MFELSALFKVEIFARLILTEIALQFGNESMNNVHRLFALRTFEICLEPVLLSKDFFQNIIQSNVKWLAKMVELMTLQFIFIT